MDRDLLNLLDDINLLLNQKKDLFRSILETESLEKALYSGDKTDVRALRKKAKLSSKYTSRIGRLDDHLDINLELLKQVPDLSLLPTNQVWQEIQESMKELEKLIGEIEKNRADLKVEMGSLVAAKKENIKKFRVTKVALNKYELNARDAHLPETSYFLDRKK